MEPIDLFTLTRANDESRAELSLGGRPVGLVDGRAMEAQFSFPSGYVVITSDDDPWEEVAHIYLIDRQLRIADAMALGARFHSGAIRDFSVRGDNRLEFSFFGNDRWRLTIGDEPKIELFRRVASSAWYPEGWLRRHYLRLERLS